LAIESAIVITKRSRFSFILQKSQNLSDFLFKASLFLLSLVKFLFKGSQSVLDFGLLVLSFDLFLLNLDLLVKNLLDHRAELLLESFVLSDVSLGRLLGLLSHAIQSFLQLGLKLRNPLISDFAHLTDGAFPGVKFIVFIVIGGNNEKETLNFLVNFAVRRTTLMNVGREVAE